MSTIVITLKDEAEGMSVSVESDGPADSGSHALHYAQELLKLIDGEAETKAPEVLG